MSNAPLVDILGMVAGGVWLSGAVYFQMIRAGSVHPAYVAVLLSIGVSLVLSSSAIALQGPGLIETLAILANVCFILIGIGVWFGLERAAGLREAKALDSPTDDAEALNNTSR